MKIYYYKQQQNTSALFDKKSSFFRLRYLAPGAMLLTLSVFSVWKFTYTPKQKLALNETPAPIVLSADPNLQSSLLDEEAQATTLKIQSNIEQDAHLNEDLKPEPESATSNDKKIQTVTIKKRDNLGKVFARLDISKKDVPLILKAGEAAKELKKLKPGQKISLAIQDHHVQQLTYIIDDLSTLIISKASNDKYKTQMKMAALDTKQSIAKFTVIGSVTSSAKKAGLNTKRLSQLAGIFKASVDFNKGTHTGDNVSVLFQDYYSNGKKVKDGEIVAAEIKTATNTYQAVRFTDPKGNSGYYSPDGTSMQKRFLPAPLKFTHISSLFNPKRWHPVLHRFRHHQGVDYAAPYGTPIKSVANGTIAHLGRQGGYGNTIMIKHDSSYSTLYGHLSKYATGLKAGSHVQQGQLIGYVGSSGLATGPHLHFEFRINGVHKNPLTVALPNGKSITHAYRNKFHNEVKKLLAKLDAHKHSSRG